MKKQKQYFYSKRSHQGFSIIEALIGMVLLGALAFAFSDLILGALKGQKRVQNAVDFDILKTSLNQVFSTKACNGSLYTGAGLTTFVFPPGIAPGDDLADPATFPTGIPVDEVKHGASKVCKRDEMIPGGLKVTSLALTSAIYDGDQTIGGVTYKAFASRFHLKVTKSNAPAGLDQMEHTLSVRLLANSSTGRVEKCGGLSGETPFVSVYRNAGLPMTCSWNGVTWLPSMLSFDNVEEDNWGIYNTTNSNFVFPEGLWQITASAMSYNPIAGGRHHLFFVLYKNTSTVVVNGPVFRNADSDSGAAFTTIIRSNGTDTYSLALNLGNCSGGATLDGGQQNIRMQAFQIGR